MRTAVLNCPTETISDKTLEEIGREAAGLERENLSKAGRLRLKKILTAVEELQKQHAPTQSSFSPLEAGERLLVELMNDEGGAWSGAELEKKYGVSPAVLHRRRKEYRIVYWRDARHAFFYPRWQFTGTGAILPGIQEVLQTFRSQDEWRIMRYFLSPRKQLDGQCPLDLLRSGNIERVLTNARDHAAENTW